MSANGSVPISDVDNLGPIIERFSERLASIENRLDRLERAQDHGTVEKADRIDAVLRHAYRLNDGRTVKLDYTEVMAAAGVSKTTAYDYMKTALPERASWITYIRNSGAGHRVEVDFPPGFTPPSER